jgi:hypothetical protein
MKVETILADNFKRRLCKGTRIRDKPFADKRVALATKDFYKIIGNNIYELMLICMLTFCSFSMESAVFSVETNMSFCLLYARSFANLVKNFNFFDYISVSPTSPTMSRLV